MPAPTSPTEGRPPMDLLRFATAGSVDDGKSTLIGRLLLDSKAIFEDQLEAVESTSKSRGYDYTDLALLTDGLRSEREQGITIDVAYRYFATPSRKFIIADTPGHVQYTRNMVTGASTADLGLVLVDARQGLTEQSRRHAVILSLLRVPHLVLAVNKMDLVDFDEKVFRSIHEDEAQVGGGGAGDHVARVLHVAGGVRDDELAGRRREVAVGHVDRDALLALGAEPVGEQREVGVVVALAAAGRLHGLELVLEDRLGVVQQTADECALAVVYAARRREAEHVHLAVRVSRARRLDEPNPGRYRTARATARRA